MSPYWQCSARLTLTSSEQLDRGCKNGELQCAMYFDLRQRTRFSLSLPLSLSLFSRSLHQTDTLTTWQFSSRAWGSCVITFETLSASCKCLRELVQLFFAHEGSLNMRFFFVISPVMHVLLSHYKCGLVFVLTR